MNDYFYLIQQRINKYERLYRANSRKAALKLLWWNIRWLFAKNSKVKSLTGNTIKVAVKLNGGVGDILMQSTYIKELAKFLNGEDVSIDFFAFKDEDTPASVFYNAHFVKNVFSQEHFRSKSHNYDLILSIQRFVMIVHIDWERVRVISEQLTKYCEAIQKFYEENSFVINNSPYTDMLSTRLAELNDKNRVNQPDIAGFLGMSKEPANFMDINPDYINLLSKLGLEDQIYLTIQRGINHTDANKESVKSWPVVYYENLIKLIKQKYPEIVLVQMGFSETWCEKLIGVDIDLRGKTSFEELKILLKYAVLHIDYEGGYMHIRHFFNAPSVVLFGPTDLEFYKYPENINIKSEGCPSTCEWVNPDWTLKCSRGLEKPPCMDEIQPANVFQQIVQYMEKKDSFSYRLQDSVTFLELISLISQIDNNARVACINYHSAQDLKKMLKQKQIQVFSPNITKQPDTEFSGVYNVAAISNCFDFIVAEIMESTLYPEYSLLDILRVLKPNGVLALKGCNLNLQEVALLAKLDLSSYDSILLEKDFLIIQKIKK